VPRESSFLGNVRSEVDPATALKSIAAHVPVIVKDALAGEHGEYEMVLTNPPFGKKSSVTIVNEARDEEKQSLVVHRDDFWTSTSNKQLNFLQHVFTILKQHGRAAIVVPTTSSSKAALRRKSGVKSKLLTFHSR
jgi:type I restriction-modification system DNA methylase subunit